MFFNLGFKKYAICSFVLVFPTLPVIPIILPL